MTLGFTKKGMYVIALIRAIKMAATIPADGRIEVPGYGPASYLGPSLIEDGIQMHGFRLSDGKLLALESDRLTDSFEIAQKPTAQPQIADVKHKIF